ncbi:MAG: hypothetical protein KDA30_13745 [Phycisphaerales bacterium]|nr:hypothetical protein [Phycisphaerales bacterium]
MKPRPFLACLLTALALTACASSHQRTDDNRAAHTQWADDNPDPSIHIAIHPPAGYTPEPDLAERLGAYRIYSDATGHRYVISYTPAPEAPAEALQHRLTAHAQKSNAALLEAVPGKRVAEIPPLPDDPFARAALPTRAFAYPTGAGSDVICDSAAIFAATPAGIWTISWNAPVGQLDQAQSAIAEFLRSLRVERANNLTR